MVITRQIRYRLSGGDASVNLREHAVVVASGSKPRISHEEATYFDTPDLQLYKKGMALTLHKEGKGWLQRLGKAPVLFTASDAKGGKAFQTKLAENILNVKKLNASGVGRRVLGKIKPESLVRHFSLELDRTLWRLDFPDGCRMLLKEEKGFLVTEKDRIPFHELCMELEHGDESRLFQIALALLYQLSPRLETSSPEQRGFLQVDPSMATAYSRSIPQLNPSMDAEQGFARLAAHLTNVMEGNVASLFYGRDTFRYDALWEVAVAVDQFRALLAFNDFLLPGIMRSELDEELAWLQSELADAKKWEEFINGMLEPCIDQFPTYPELQDLTDKAKVHLREGYVRLEHAMASFRFTRLICGLRYWVGGQAWRELTDLPQKRQAARSITLLAKSAVDRHHSQVLKLGEPALAAAEGDSLTKLDHEGAVALYAMDFYISLFQDRKAKAYHNSLDWVMTGVRGLQRVQLGRGYFDRIIPADNAALRHLVNGWLGGRREVFMLDGREAWNVFSTQPQFWQ
ncbi:MAG: CHAD domain-containing protein [Magnetococcales bacterium]|nr:CHAD domain-containing protein [Magnetococcales bacterium]NGZ26872.1 CHAD domain-containing protein [Magnetococcales bacterium]